jgi:ribonuclease I
MKKTYLTLSTNDFFDRWKELVTKKKLKDIPLKKDDKEQIEKLSAALKTAVEAKENAKTNEDKIASTVAIEEAKMAIKEVRMCVKCICSIEEVYIIGT